MTKIDSTGRKRPAIEVRCKYCQTRFVTFVAPSRKAKYCSISCSKRDRLKTVKLHCAQCKTEFVKASGGLGNSKSGLRFCSKACKCKAQRIGGIREIMPHHYGTTKIDYRSYFSEDELVCSRCGYEEFKSSVQVHHKDKNHDNNSKENLIPLCANCHSALHNNRWKLN